MTDHAPSAIPPAVIMAAGRGNRLLPLTKDRPKCMLEVGGEAILVHQIKALQAIGVESIQIVTGHGEAVVREACAALDRDGLSFARNADYATTNSLQSLGCTTLDPPDAGLLILNSDVLFHRGLAQRLIEDSRENVLLADFFGLLGEEEMKICVDTDNRITAISKALDPMAAQAENLGVLKVGREAAALLLEVARHPPAEVDKLCWVPDAIHYLRFEFDFFALPTGGLPWIEIDYEHDLKRAREQVWPKIALGLVR